ncbi:MAG: T9SS type A sorting domain-containing protein [Opitutaceae bacterium]|nr:T9SS type A sorting domain-containing protein [Cytophagales bacterium]
MLKISKLVIGILSLFISSRIEAQSLFISPSKAEPSTQLVVTISGSGVRFGQGSSCVQPQCIDLGTNLIFNSGSSTISVPYSSLTFLADTMAQAVLTVPSLGYYYLQTSTGYGFSNQFLVETAPKPVPSISLSPSSGQSGTNLTVTVTGTNTYFGSGSSCLSDPNCTDLGTAFYFNQGSGTSSSLPFTSLNILDQNHAQVGFDLPVYSGYYQLSTASGLQVSNQLYVTPKQQPTVYISPGSGLENTTLSVTITGNGTSFGQGSSCLYPDCIDLGSTLYFQAGSSSVSSVPLETLYFRNDTSAIATATITLPGAGNYSIRTSNGFFFANQFSVYTKPSPALYITPSNGEVNSLLTVTVSGVNTFIGTGAACSGNPNCTDIGDAFHYNQGSSTLSLPFTSILVTDSGQAVVSFYAPAQSGYYQLFTSNGTIISNGLNVTPKPLPTITISPSIGLENSLLKVTITGNGAIFGQGSSCLSNPNCIDLGSSLYFNSGSSTISAALTSVNYVDNQHVTANLSLPYSGYYTVKTFNGNNATDYFIVNPKPRPSLSISPNTGIEGTTLKVTITGDNIVFGKGNKCMLPECMDLGTELSFFGQASPSTSGTFPLSNVKITDKSHAVISIKLPAAGAYTLRTSNGVYISNYLFVTPKPKPSFFISPSEGITGNTLSVTITGSNVKLGKGNACNADPACTNIGTGFSYFSQGSSTVYGTIPFSSVRIIDAQHVNVTIKLPSPGVFALKLDNGLSSDNYLSVLPKPAPTFTFTPNSVVEGQKIAVTITGSNTKFGVGTKCSSDPLCTDLGDVFYFVRQGSPTTSGSIPFIYSSVISETEAKVTFIAPSVGEYNVSLVNNIRSTTPLIVSKNTVISPLVLGIDDTEMSGKNINVYPNPTQGILNVGNRSSVLYNSVGEIVMVSDKEVLDITNMQSGLYMLKLTDNKGSVSRITIRKE